MPEQIRCPSCGATLRVPENLLGMAVKCPKCETTFTAALAPPPPAAIVTEPPRRAERLPELEDEPFGALEDEDYPRRRFVDAEVALAGPAIALMVVAGLDFLAGVFRLLLPLLGLSMAFAGGGAGRVGGNGGLAAEFGINGLLGVLHFTFGGLILAGAIKMKKVKSFGFAMTACILAMIPCSGCCLLGLPFGIWGLVILNKPEVKDAFTQRNPEDMANEIG
jgi:predicted Zn finger-like uncharacterized protein